MKKTFHSVISVLLLAALLGGCSGQIAPADTGTAVTPESAAPTEVEGLPVSDTEAGSGVGTMPDTTGTATQEETVTASPDTSEADPSEQTEAVYDRSCFNGVGFVPLYMPAGTDVEEMTAYVGKLGAVSVRLWAPFNELLEAPDRINGDTAAYMHRVIKALRDNGVTRIIAMNHDWYIPDASGNPVYAACAVPQRGTDAYNVFLDWFETSWKTVAQEFPDVDGWETGNEANHIPFLHASEGEEFDLLQRADICTDMMFRACRAIRSVSKDKIVVMPGMAPIGGQRIGVYAESIAVEYDGMVQTLERIYTNIESGAYGSTNPRDFFDKLCWHPYYAKQNADGAWSLLCPDREWVEVNQAVYAVAQAHGDGSIGVYFSEYGYNDGGDSGSDKALADYIVKGLKLTMQKLPFVESVQVYRLFNYMVPAGSWDEYSLCDAKTTPVREKEKFVRVRKFYAQNSDNGS